MADVNEPDLDCVEAAMNPAMVQRLVEHLRGLADANRLQLLMRLRLGPASVGDLAEAVDIAQASASKHLAVLKRLGMVRLERDGNRRVYHLTNNEMLEICQSICQSLRQQQVAELAALMNSPSVEGARNEHH